MIPFDFHTKKKRILSLLLLLVSGKEMATWFLCNKGLNKCDLSFCRKQHLLVPFIASPKVPKPTFFFFNLTKLSLPQHTILSSLKSLVKNKNTDWKEVISNQLKTLETVWFFRYGIDPWGLVTTKFVFFFSKTILMWFDFVN